jgi:lipoate-protein ligase A
LTWLLLETWGGAAAWNMAVDAWLLADARREGAAVLRLYDWDPAALSLGYFQRLAEVPAAAGRDPERLVRRVTGGGAIHHAHELTFSIAADLSHPLYAGAVADSYRAVHERVATALARFGVAASERGGRLLDSDRAGTGMCFHASHPLDLVWEQAGGLRKGVGSAQRRSAGRVVHHGSIKLAPDPLEPGVAYLEQAPSAREVGLALAEVLCPGARRIELEAAERDRIELEFLPRFTDRTHLERR